MSYDYEPIKDLEKEIEYVRWTHEKEAHAHRKAVIGTQLEKLEARVHKFKQAAKADEYEVKAKAFDDIREARKEVLTDVRARGLKLPADLDKFSLMTERIINEYERGESE